MRPKPGKPGRAAANLSGANPAETTAGLHGVCPQASGGLAEAGACGLAQTGPK